MKRNVLIVFVLFFINANAQIYDDYLGAGHNQGISVTTSSNNTSSTGIHAVDGTGLKADLKGVSRFLNQATVGADFATIQNVSNIGISTWLNQQLALPPEVSYLDSTKMIWNYFVQQYINMYGAGSVLNNQAITQNIVYWRMAYWNNILKSEDILRQRVAFALSEIFVVSDVSNLDVSAYGIADYYDLLYKNAFGNYRDLLFNITMHPSMGFYLSHLNNPKSNIAANTFPDENYAREVMQLFSIGLFELNIDGSKKFDSIGNYIPTYNNNVIKEFAKVFTGFAPAQYYWHWDPSVSAIPVQWGNAFNAPLTMNMTMPMQIMNNWHEPGVKHLLRNYTIPAGQSGLQDVNNAIDNLFNHPNVGPFISKQLIQRLVKSNPTSGYIERVATVFNDNGQGVRGDLGAVVKAILLDSEARDCSWLNDNSSGKLREPFMRAVQLLKAFNAYNQSNKLYGFGYLVSEVSKQHVMSSPSVFNFYLPDFQPNGPILDADLVAPEFQLHTSTSSVDYLNFIYDSFLAEIYLLVSTKSSTTSIGFPETNPSLFNTADSVKLNLSAEVVLISQPQNLVDRLDLILTGGQLSAETKEIIIQTIIPLQPYDDLAVKAALYLIMLSPDYNIRK